MSTPEYVAPELELIGDAAELVQGGMWVGGDPGGEVIVQEMEFQTDSL